MRQLGELVFALVLGLFCWWLAPWQWIDRVAMQLKEFSATQGVRETTLYSLTTEKFIQFPLPQKAQSAALLAVAAIDQPMQDNEIAFALDYQLLDLKGRIIFSDRYHHKARIPKGVIAKGAHRPLFFYHDKPWQLAWPQPQFLPPTYIERAAFIRIKWVNTNKALADVSVQLAYLPYKQPKLQSFAWRRLNPLQQVDLASPHIFGEKALNANEKISALLSQFVPLGPYGIEGEMYHKRLLYRTQGKKIDGIDNRMAEHVRWIDSAKVASFKLPATVDQTVPLKLTFFGHATAQKILVRWLSHRDFSEKHTTFEIKGQSDEWTASFEPGWIEVTSALPVWLKAAIPASAYPSADVLAPRQIPAWIPDMQDVIYSLPYQKNHDAVWQAKVRLDVRKLAGQTKDQLGFEWQDAEGHAISKGQIRLDQPISRYDFVRREGEQLPVTEVYRRVFTLPNHAKRLVIKDAEGMLLSFYSRPIDYQRIRHVGRGEFDAPSDIPSMFLTKPDNWRQFRSSGRMVWVNAQHRLPEIETDIIAGEYEWLPIKTSSMQHEALVSVSPRSQTSLRNLGKRFTRIMGKDSRLSLASFFHQSEVSPTIFYRSETDRVREIIIRLGDKAISQWVNQKQGRFSLPEKPQGHYALQVLSDTSDELYVNYVQKTGAGSKARVFQKRTLVDLSQGEANFSVEKRSKKPQDVVVTFYPQRNRGKLDGDLSSENLSAALSARINCDQDLSQPLVQVSQDDTIFNHKVRFLFADQVADLGWFLHGKRQLGASHSFTLRLGDDLPRGFCQITVRQIEGVPGFIHVHSLIAGDYTWLRWVKN
ncbi:MAG: hypothetical protein OXE99_00360 [Cellvibrionales bacterium]|nr:hypothetical protein [Cellvibrionales bacterium]